MWLITSGSWGWAFAVAGEMWLRMLTSCVECLGSSPGCPADSSFLSVCALLESPPLESPPPTWEAQVEFWDPGPVLAVMDVYGVSQQMETVIFAFQVKKKRMGTKLFQNKGMIHCGYLALENMRMHFSVGLVEERRPTYAG